MTRMSRLTLGAFVLGCFAWTEASPVRSAEHSTSQVASTSIKVVENSPVAAKTPTSVAVKSEQVFRPAVIAPPPAPPEWTYEQFETAAAPVALPVVTQEETVATTEPAPTMSAEAQQAFAAPRSVAPAPVAVAPQRTTMPVATATPAASAPVTTPATPTMPAVVSAAKATAPQTPVAAAPTTANTTAPAPAAVAAPAPAAPAPAVVAAPTPVAAQPAPTVTAAAPVATPAAATVAAAPVAVAQATVDAQVETVSAEQRYLIARQALVESTTPEPAAAAPAESLEATAAPYDDAVEPAPPGSVEYRPGPPACTVPCRRPAIFVVGTEALFLGTDVQGVDATTSFSDLTAPTTRTFDDPDVDNFTLAPRLWLGVQGECWGAYARYFHLRAGEKAVDPFIIGANHAGLPDVGFFANNYLEAYYVDAELARNFCCHCWRNQITFGARYAEIQYDEAQTSFAQVPEGFLQSSALACRRFSGTGITSSLNGRRPLFCNSCVHWYYAARGSVLWGCSHSHAETSAQAAATGSATAIGGSFNGAIASVNDDLFIGELQTGLEWDFALMCLPARSFFRVGFEYQYWEAASGGAFSTSFAGFGNPNPTSLINSTASARAMRLELIGLAIGTGFTW